MVTAYNMTPDTNGHSRTDGDQYPLKAGFYEFYYSSEALRDHKGEIGRRALGK
jgi:hypothetical protein